MLLQLCMLPTESRECPQFVSSRVTTADAEIKVISAENPELSTCLSLKPGWSRSEYNPGCYTYGKEFILSKFCLPGSFNFIFFK